MKKYKKVFALMVFTLFCFQGLNVVAMDEANSEASEWNSSGVRKRSHVTTTNTTNCEDESDESSQGTNHFHNCLDIFGKITKILLRLVKIYMLFSSGEYTHPE